MQSAFYYFVYVKDRMGLHKSCRLDQYIAKDSQKHNCKVNAFHFFS